MAYTTDDLAQVRKAILELASGARVSMIVKDGRTVQYASTDIDKLRALERTIAGEIKAGSGRRTRTRYTVTSKGL